MAAQMAPRRPQNPNLVSPSRGVPPQARQQAPRMGYPAPAHQAPRRGYPTSQAHSPRPVQQSPARGKKQIPVKKRGRREKDYFYVMRRGVCFTLLLFALLWVGILALNYLDILPNFTSFLTEKDLTPLDERLDVDTGELDDDGNAIMEAYVDQSKYISFMDPIYGAISNVILGTPIVDEEGVSLSPFYDEMHEKIVGPLNEEVTAEAAEEAGDTETGEPEESNNNLTEDTLAREEDSMMMVAQIAFPYFPLAIVLAALAAVLILLLSFFSLFGRRIFKGFLVFSIVILIAGLLTFVAGFAASGSFSGNPRYLEDGTLVSIIDFSKITDFLMGSFLPVSETALDPEIDILPLPMVAGIGSLALLVLPIVMMLLSLFVKKKVPYSIFDR